MSYKLILHIIGDINMSIKIDFGTGGTLKLISESKFECFSRQ